MKKIANLRSVAAKIIELVIEQGQSLNNLLPKAKKNFSDKNGALLQEISFGVLRMFPLLEIAIKRLMLHPLIGKQRTIHYLIMVGLYQLIHTRIPPYAILSETVEGTTFLNHQNLKGLVNGVLRKFQRQKEFLLPAIEIEPQRFLHPIWLLNRLQLAWPNQWKQIVEANNQHPPMWIRVNQLHHTRDQFLTLLLKSGNNATPHPLYPNALMLEKKITAKQLPGFNQGWVTVQDASAQGCIPLLAPKKGEYILDLCAAPGGKTTHILEVAPEAKVMAVDIDIHRLKRIQENLQRLGMKACVKQGDGRFPRKWCGNMLFDRILLDAPCSATGIIRRHPDIKWTKYNHDIVNLVATQKKILDAIWPHLKIGGTLVYSTCSVLPEENHIQINKFLSCHIDAKAINLVDNTEDSYPGVQYFPHPYGGDGFFYAKLKKQL